MSFVFAPKGWALCNGQLLPINQNQALFSLLGTTFGGDGRVNFALPDLRGRAPIHVGSGHTLGERGGEQAHTLSIAELPTHTHVVHGRQRGHGRQRATRPDAVLGGAQRTSTAPADSLDGAATRHRDATSGGSQAHLNMQPFLTLELLHRPAGHLPAPDLEEAEPWHNPTSARSGCSRATSRPPAGCSARASCCRSPRTRRCSS